MDYGRDVFDRWRAGLDLRAVMKDDSSKIGCFNGSDNRQENTRKLGQTCRGSRTE